MAHRQQINIVRKIVEHLAHNWEHKYVLEVGSYDVSGTVRPFFHNSNYVGVDLIFGPGVDFVCEGDKLDFPDSSFDVCISCECFEHNKNWVETFNNMYRMTREGGAVIITCASTGRLEHGTRRTSTKSSPGTQNLGWNYYRNLNEKDFIEKFDMKKLFSDYFIMNNKYSCDLILVGIKCGDEMIFCFDREKLKNECLRVSEYTYKHEKSKSKYPYPKVFEYISMISRLPFRLAAVLPDPCYQNIMFWYLKGLEKIKKPLRKILFRI